MSEQQRPYGFIPIPVDDQGVPKSATGKPVWHDGANSSELHSGELHLSFTTLTPTLVGNTQYDAASAKGSVGAGKDKVRLPEASTTKDGVSRQTLVEARITAQTDVDNHYLNASEESNSPKSDCTRNVWLGSKLEAEWLLRETIIGQAE